jgi:hypothetical protein
MSLRFVVCLPILFLGEPAITSSLLQLRTGRFDKKENGFKKAKGLSQGSAGNNNSGTTMPFIKMVKGKFDFSTYLKRPLGKKADSLGRPINLMINEIY